MKEMNTTVSSAQLAAAITRTASAQTYITIRLLADRARMANAYRAYAYFRWVDDTLDAPSGSLEERQAFLERQRALLQACYEGKTPPVLLPEEQMLTDLLQDEPDQRSGLHTYLNDMMQVMIFDTERRGRLISGTELNEYTRCLASAVTEALHYFIDRDCGHDRDETRCMAVSAAHITHMLRDTFDDIDAGYFNIPREVLEMNRISPADVESDAYREWVKGRVELARRYFFSGACYLRRSRNLRFRLACLAYVSRFEGVLDLIEKDGYILRPVYPELSAGKALGRAALGLFGGFMDRHRDYLASSQSSTQERTL